MALLSRVISLVLVDTLESVPSVRVRDALIWSTAVVYWVSLSFTATVVISHHVSPRGGLPLMALVTISLGAALIVAGPCLAAVAALL